MNEMSLMTYIDINLTYKGGEAGSHTMFSCSNTTYNINIGRCEKFDSKTDHF